MKRIFNILVGAFVVVFALQSCNLEETNIDPNQLNDVPLSLILPTAISQTAYNQSALSARMPGIVMQHFRGFDAQQVAYTNYVITEIEFNNTWRTGFYAGALKDCDVIITKAQAEGQPHYEGIAKVIMAYNYAMATSFFGDIPFSEALKGVDNLKPAYDTQEQVYTGVLALLDEAIGLLGQASVPGGPSGDDPIYGGDATSWASFAQAVKARVYMHLSKRDAGNYAKAMTAVNAAFGSLADQPSFTFDAAEASANPIAQFGSQRSGTLIIHEQFEAWMAGNNDPRKDVYMVFNGSDYEFWASGNPALIWAQNSSTIPMISYVELLFIRAEAMSQTGASVAEVQTALEAAISASMEQNGLDLTAQEVVDYIAARGDLSGMSGDDVLKRIIEEAYVGYFGFAFSEAWTNFRRTGYPALTPSPLGANGLNPSGVVPKRFLYPSSENDTNNGNYQAAKDRQSGALLDVATWANQ